MYYVCYELDGTFIGAFNYKPNVPTSVKMFEITDQQHAAIVTGAATICPDTGSVTELVIESAPHPAPNQARAFLDGTDWMVLRHIREKALGLTPHLTDAEYLELEHRRQAAADVVP